MMDQAGKCILINGPPMAGKTRLSLMLTRELPMAKVVNFELFLRKEKTLDECYELFYDNILSLVEKGHLVIGESIRSYAGKDIQVCKLNDYFNIVVDPGNEQHYRNIKKHADTFGNVVTKKRTGGFTPRTLWERFTEWAPKDALVFNGRNFENILLGVKKYVGNGTHGDN